VKTLNALPIAVAVLALCVPAAAQVYSVTEGPVLDIGSRVELFVDDWLVDTMQAAYLQMHRPVRRQVALTLDAPWEGDVCFYLTVLRDDECYRMYYRGQQMDAGGPVPVHEAIVAYAESEDGISWKRPNLGLHEFGGTKDNAVVWVGAGTHNFTPFKDLNPDCKPQERYKALAGGPLIAFCSPDGINWKQMQEKAVITQGAFDSQNLAFWDPVRECYADYHRGFRDGVRDVMTCTSTDFLNWTQPQWLDWGDSAVEHLYTNAITPYFRAPQVLVGFPKRFVPTRHKIKSHEEVGVSDGLLVTSRDGVHFKRWREAFLRPGPDQMNWTERSNLIGFGVVPISDEEMSLYAIENYRHATIRIRRLSLRTDGFVSVHADAEEGQMTTKPFTFDGSRLVINYSTSAAGSVRVQIEGATGQAVPGYTLDDCPEIYGDEIERTVTWAGSDNLLDFRGLPIRLRFALRDADLYSIRFMD